VRTTLERLTLALASKYEVKRLIGRGGFAEVYELWDKDLDRRLACKVLHPEIAWTPACWRAFGRRPRRWPACRTRPSSRSTSPATVRVWSIT